MSSGGAAWQPAGDGGNCHNERPQTSADHRLFPLESILHVKVLLRAVQKARPSRSGRLQLRRCALPGFARCRRDCVGFVPEWTKDLPHRSFRFGKWREWILRSAWGSPGTRKTPPRTVKNSWKSRALSHRSRGRVNPPAGILKSPARPPRVGGWRVGSRTRAVAG